MAKIMFAFKQTEQTLFLVTNVFQMQNILVKI